jgi:hypothetical protein
MVHRPHEELFKEVINLAFKKVFDVKKHIVLIEPNIIDHIVEGKSDDIYLSFGARFFHMSHIFGNIERN